VQIPDSGICPSDYRLVGGELLSFPISADITGEAFIIDDGNI